jgi:hypothetical protein
MSQSLKSRVRRLEAARAATQVKPFDLADRLRLARQRSHQRTPVEVAADRARLISSLSEPDLPANHPAATVQRARRRLARSLEGTLMAESRQHGAGR